MINAKMPLVSVVIPCYNHEKFLKSTVESVFSSSYPNLEVIIVDDGSTDRSLQVAMELKSRFDEIYVISQENSGPSVARNNGIERAKGRYILPLDADDLISTNYIEEAVRILESNPNVKVVYAEAEKFGAVNKKWKLKSFSHYKLALDNMIYVSALYRKEEWLRVGGYSDSKVLCREDWEFWIKVLKDGGEVEKLPFTGFYYRILPNSRRKSMTRKQKREEIELLNKKHKDFFEKHLNGPLRVNRTYSKFYNTLLKKLKN